MPRELMSGVQAAVGGGANFDIQPAVADAYEINEVGSDQVFVGGVPDVQVSIVNGVLAACIVQLDPTTAVQKAARPKKLLIDNTVYLNLVNTAVGAAVISWSGRHIRPDVVRSAMVTAPNGGTVDIQPAVGEVWRVYEMGCEVMNATNWPDITVHIWDGATAAVWIADGARNAVWPKRLNWILSNAIRLRLAPIAGADRDVGISAELVDVEAFSAVFAIGAGANVDIQPAEGQECCITEFGASVWAGVAPAGNPDVTVRITDGATPSNVIEAGSVADSLIRNRDFELWIDNTIYLNVLDTGGAGVNVGYLGYIIREEHTT